MNHPIMFLDRGKKGKLVPASFSYSINLGQKCVIVMCFKETSFTVLFKLLLQKSSLKVKLGEFKTDQN